MLLYVANGGWELFYPIANFHSVKQKQDIGKSKGYFILKICKADRVGVVLPEE